MKIVFDIQALQGGSRFRGIGRHALNLSKEIIHLNTKHDIHIVINGTLFETVKELRQIYEPLVTAQNIHIFYSIPQCHYLSPENELRRKVSEIQYDAFINNIQPDLLYVFSLFDDIDVDIITFIPHTRSYIKVITIHDLIPLLKPDVLGSKLQKKWYQEKIGLAKRADYFCAISNSSLQEAVEYLNVLPQKICNINNGFSENIATEVMIESEKKLFFVKNDITQPYILNTGGVDPHKNIEALINAYANLPANLKDKFQLIITCGKHHEEKQRLRNICDLKGISREKILLLDYISDAELALLYKNCVLFVFPSKHEGVGLTPLEAMHFGSPVIGSNVTSIPEIIGLDQALFDPYSIDSITQKMTQVLTNENFRQQLILHAKKQVKKFSWEKSAQKVLNFFDTFELQKDKEKRILSYSDILKIIKKTIQQSKIFFSKIDYLETARLLNLNFPDKKNLKQIFVHVLGAHTLNTNTGIQRVTRSILLELLNNPPAGYKIMPVYEKNNLLYYACDFTNKLLKTQNTVEEMPIDFSAGDVYLCSDLIHDIFKYSNFLNLMHNHGVTIKFIVYDLIPVLHNAVFNKNIVEAHSNWLKAIAQFDGIICISNAVKEELRQWYSEKNITTKNNFSYNYFHLGQDIENSAPTRGMPEDVQIVLEKIHSKQSFLIVSTVEPRKGHDQALEAMDLLWKKNIDVNFVIVGVQGWNVDSLVEKLKNHKEKGKRLFWLQGISDEYLDLVYQTSTVVLMPSIAEGFGLALIEAARYNKPLIVRDIPVFREIAAEHAYYFSGMEAQDLAGALENWLKLYAEGKHPTTQGMKTLTWKESTQNLLKVLLQ